MRGRLLAAALLCTAIVSRGPVRATQQPSFSSRTLAVRVDVLVTDGRNPVAGLTAQDFELRDNGVAQSVALVDSADVPINVVLALDTSASIAGKRQTDLVAASQAILDGLKPADRAALTSFSHAVVPRVELTSNFPSVRDELARIKPSGETAIMDGVYVALTTTLAQSGRSLVVVYTDGADTQSWLTADEVLESAKRSSAVVYAVAATDATHLSPLEDLIDATGGRLLRIASTRDLRGAFEKILQDFRSRYILAYTPTGVPSGGLHRLDVRVKRRGLNVRARPGYIGVETK
jgi:VWFA-related protein